jgi:hypothetical protein
MLGALKKRNSSLTTSSSLVIIQFCRVQEEIHDQTMTIGEIEFHSETPTATGKLTQLSIEREDGPSSPGTSIRQFVLQPPHEYVVCVRYNSLDDGTITGIQFQTNLGRRSKFYGTTPILSLRKGGRVGNRHELYAPPGQAIIGFHRSTESKKQYDIDVGKAPLTRRKKLRKLLLLPSVRSVLLKTTDSVTNKSVALKMMHGGRKAVALQAVRHGLASKMLAAGEDGDALVRLVLDGEQHVKHHRSSTSTTRRLSSLLSVASPTPTLEAADDDESEDQDSIQFPPSVLRAICEKGDSYEFSLMDLLMAGKEREGRTPLMRLLFESGIANVVFKKQKNVRCLAELMMTPDRIRGLRSIMQLMTDDEALDDPTRPSLMRSLLIGEENGERPSILRLMFIKSPGKTVTSLMDEMLRGEADTSDCIARRLLTETDDLNTMESTNANDVVSSGIKSTVSLGRLFFSDSPSGKPSLAKYVFGGEKSSLMRLMCQGEARSQNSLLRLLTGFRGSSNKSLMDLLTSGKPSLMDILLKGEESALETSLARQMLGTTFTIENGRVKMGNMLGSTSKSLAHPNQIVSTISMAAAGTADINGQDQLRKRLQRGMTIAKACMLGEEDGGPGLSMMRVLLLGEEQGTSVLRLLLTGEESGDVSPLRIMVTGMHAAFVAAQVAVDSTKEIEQEGLLELAKNPSKWGEALQRITKAVVESVNESHQENGSWKESFEKLIELGKKQLQNTDAWQENIAFLWTAFARVRSMGPEFAKQWKKQWLIIAKEIRLTGNRVREGSNWKILAPSFAQLVETIAEQQWQKVFLNVAMVLQAIERAANPDKQHEDSRLQTLLTIVEEISSYAPKWF